MMMFLLHVSVCNVLIFESLDLESSFFGMRVRLLNGHVKFVY